MVSLNDLKELTLYKKQFYLPINLKDKKRGSAITLLTPNFQSSMIAMTSPFTVNNRYFESYYIEKVINRLIQNESVVNTTHDTYVFEEALTTKERNNLSDDDFGIPELKKYPMPDKKHVLMAIRFFNYVEKEYEEELASNIIKKIKQFDMAADVNVGENNRFKKYWEASGLENKKHVNESSISKDRQSIINTVNNALKKEGLKSHISKNGEWGLKKFLDGNNTICLGGFGKDNWDKAYNIVKSNIPDGYTATKDDYFTIFINSSAPSVSEITNEEYTEYFNEFVNDSAMDKVSKKLTGKTNIVFNGYKNDISSVKPYIKNNSIDICFDRLNMKSPDKVTIMVCSDNTVPEQFTEDSVLVYTPSALKNSSWNIGYADYIKYILQLYAIYTIKVNPNPRSKFLTNNRVMDSIAEPAAILLSGIASKEINSKSTKNSREEFFVEKVFKYIIDKHGIDAFVLILKNNDVKAIAKYNNEYRESIQESFIPSYKCESYAFITEEGNIIHEAEAIPATDNVPESIKKLQTMGTRLKRRIKQHSVYKLNKIMRDIERGNTGTETRDMNSLELLKTGAISNDVTSIPSNSTTSTEESFTLNQLKNWTGGDYITEGNLVYLFEDSDQYSAQLRRILFNDRFKSNKQVLDIYRRVKSNLKFIKYAYLTIPQYRNLNLFIDLSYYNEVFFRNMSQVNVDDEVNKIRVFNIYKELLERLIKDSDIKGQYTQNSIFIPVLDWRHNNSTKMWIFREDINPISVIYNMMVNEPRRLKEIFGNRDVIFMGAKNYFKINFSNTAFGSGSNTIKFRSLIDRIVKLGYNSPADPDPVGELDSSPRGIAMELINKVEKSQNVSIDNVSKFDSLNTSVDIMNKGIVPGTELDQKMAIKKIETERPAGYELSGKTDVVSYGKTKALDYSKSIRGKSIEIPVEVQKKTVSVAKNKSDIGSSNGNRAVNNPTEEDRKNAIVDAIAKVANTSDSVQTAMDQLTTDEFKEMILSLQNDSSENTRITASQASSVINTQSEFHKKEVAGKSVEDLLNEDHADDELPKSDLKVASINDDWQNMTFMNFDKDYDPDSDIVKMLDSMQHWTFPIAVKNIDVKDNSTSEDILDLWTIECIDYKGTKFTLKVDIPKFINGSNFLKLRGNEKTLMIQSTLLPIIKTGLEECQIIGSGGYNKMFVRRYGSRKGQSIPSANKLLRTLPKYASTHDDIRITIGDNTKVCKKYELPMDYTDLAQVFNTIEMDNLKIYFNQDELRSEYEVDDTKGIPIGVATVVDGNTKRAAQTILYYTADSASTLTSYIARCLIENSPEYEKYYSKFMLSNSRYTYSKASILNSKIPIVLVCAYLEGLITTMKKAGINYSFSQELDKNIKYSEFYDYIKFSDGYLIYEVNYCSSMLMNGLKENDTESYSIKDINNKKMYMEFLETFTSMINADGLENSYDCMIDPITKEILAKFKLPTDYVSVLIYASNLLADNKYIKHIDQIGRRWRRKELIAGYFYKALSTAYQEYANSCRHSRKNSKMSMKQSAVIDLFVSKDPATSDLSVNNALNDVECTNSVTNKGLVGMNVTRGYTINTRGYDESMLNLLGMDTGFSGNVGINRQATLNANIEGGRGFVKTIDGDTSKLSAANSFTITEAVTPLGSTHDDPPRTLMTYVQTSKHMIRCDNNDPTLLTTGADEAMPYLTSDIFAYKAKKEGKVVELVQEGFGKQNYMVIEYKDGSHEYVNLSEEVKKNSDGGYYVPMKLDTDLKVGDKFNAGNILAYDKLSFSKSLGESGNLAANIGTLAKVAIINTDEAFEDSAAVTEDFANKMGTYVIQEISTKLDKGVNIFVYKNIGDSVMEGDVLFDYQQDFDDDVVNTLLKNLTMDTDQISELGRTPVKSKYTGIVSDIVIYRTCADDAMSSSLRDFVSKYENKIKNIKDIYSKYGIDDSVLPKIGKVPEIGRTKNLDNAVLILYYIKYNDNVSIGDKIVFYSANKGTIKYIIPKEDEPYTAFRPNEKIDSFMSLSSISGRMTCSIPIFAATSKLMVELDRSIKEIAGIPYDESKL